MQFTYPDLLWALFLLLIPLIIHLFQLRRFKKTPFTNVRLLKKVVAKSRRSQSLKRWILLMVRLLLLACIVLAFAQPYTAGPAALSPGQRVIYLDDSYSMQARALEGTLLEEAIQDLLQVIPDEQEFSLFTNDKVFDNQTIRSIRNSLLSLTPTDKQLDLQAIYLKAATLLKQGTEGRQELVIISDFQDRMAASGASADSSIQDYLLQILPENLKNASIDSAYLSHNSPARLELTALLSNTGSMDALPVSLYNGDTLIAKTSAIWGTDQKAAVQFSLPLAVPIEGRLEITDTQLSYDNQLFFTIGNRQKIKVLSIGADKQPFLGKIFTADEFEFQQLGLENLNYSLIPSQNLIVLNELPAIPTALQNALVTFMNEGGSLTFIPNSLPDLANYNSFLNKLGSIGFGDKVTAQLSITSITFSHPLFENVFEKEVSNFQFPGVSEYYPIRSALPEALSLQGSMPFLLGADGLYIFCSPLSEASATFRASPLVVPTFYNMGRLSLRQPQLYYTVGDPVELDVPFVPGSDRILKVRQREYEFIPRQQSYLNTTRLFFEEYPEKDGQYTVTDSERALQKLSFNYNREESDLNYTEITTLKSYARGNQIAELFQRLEKEGQVTTLWKWFVILALLCMLAELLIQKFLK